MSSQFEELDQIDLNALFQTARKISSFDSYSDGELKDKLIALLYSDSNIMQKIKENPHRIDQILMQELENKHPDLSKRYRTSAFTKKIQLVSQKQESVDEVQQKYSELYLESDTLVDSYLELVNELDPFLEADFWSYMESQEKDLSTVREELQSRTYLIQTNFIVRIIDFLFGMRKAKLEQHNPFLVLPFPLLDAQVGIYGHTVVESNDYSYNWYRLIMGEVQLSTVNDFNMSTIQQLGLKDIFRSFSHIFDEILLDAELSGRTDGSAERKATYNEIMFMNIVSLSFNKILQVLSWIERVDQSFPRDNSHPLRSGMLVYPVSWMYYKWLRDFEKVHTTKTNLTSDEGPTGALCLKDIFIKIKRELTKSNKTLNLTPEQQRLKNEAKERLKYHLTIVPQLVTHLKNRLKLIHKMLLGDVISEYYHRQNLMCQYSITETFQIRVQNLVRVTDAVPESSIPQSLNMDPLISVQKKAASSSETSEESTFQPIYDMSKLKDHEVIDVMLFVDLQSELEKIVDSINACFRKENQFIYQRSDNASKYDYFRDREYYVEGDPGKELVSFDKIKNLQDHYDHLNEIISKLRIKLQPWVKNQVFYVKLQDAQSLKDSISDISLIFKDVTEYLKEMGEVPAQFKTYAEHVKNFFDINNKIMKKMLKK